MKASHRRNLQPLLARKMKACNAARCPTPCPSKSTFLIMFQPKLFVMLILDVSNLMRNTAILLNHCSFVSVYSLTNSPDLFDWSVTAVWLFVFCESCKLNFKLFVVFVSCVCRHNNAEYCFKGPLYLFQFLTLTLGSI